MHKFLKLSAVSMLAVMTANGAHAAGYTCEELIEYTSCNPGYYLLNSRCPTGAFYYENVCCDGIDCSENTYGDEAGCLDDDHSDRTYHANGCFVDSDDGYMYYRGSPSSSGSTGCADCPAGSTCAGGTAGATPCPAGSYCATTGLSEPTNVCAKGSYSSAGAVACTSCPATQLTDINGNTVVATTLSTGSYNISACIVGPDVQFKNDAGIYHFTQNCKYDTTLGSYEPSGSSCKPGYVLAKDGDIHTYKCFEIPQFACSEVNTDEGASTTWNTATNTCECDSDGWWYTDGEDAVWCGYW